MKSQLCVFLLLSFTFVHLSAQNFTGKYSTVQNGVECIVEFKQAGNQQLTGQISVGGEKGSLKGAVANGIASGTIADAATKQVFQFESAIEADLLTFIMYV